MSGVNTFSYWLGNYAWDLINAFIIVIIAFILIVVFQTDGYKGQGLGAVFILMVSTYIVSERYILYILYKAQHLRENAFRWLYVP